MHGKCYCHRVTRSQRSNCDPRETVQALSDTMRKASGHPAMATVKPVVALAGLQLSCNVGPNCLICRISHAAGALPGVLRHCPDMTFSIRCSASIIPRPAAQRSKYRELPECASRTQRLVVAQQMNAFERLVALLAPHVHMLAQKLFHTLPDQSNLVYDLYRELCEQPER